MNEYPELHITLWSSFPHFRKTIEDSRVDGIRLNGPITFSLERIAEDVNNATKFNGARLYFDVKARQLRVVQSMPYQNHLELKVNHQVEIRDLPKTVLFKDGTDHATLIGVNGDILIFEGGPKLEVVPCEPVYIRPPEFEIKGNVISEYEAERIRIAKNRGINSFMLSYVESDEDIARLREHVGNDAEIVAKIESRKGMEYVRNQFKKQENLSLMLARGDLYVEFDIKVPKVNQKLKKSLEGLE